MGLKDVLERKKNNKKKLQTKRKSYMNKFQIREEGGLKIFHILNIFKESRQFKKKSRADWIPQQAEGKNLLRKF